MRSATTEASAEEPRQLVPDVQRAHQRRAIHKTIAALVLGKHSSGVIHEVEQVDVRDVIAAPVEDVGNVVVVGPPLLLRAWLVEDVPDLEGGSHR